MNFLGRLVNYRMPERLRRLESSFQRLPIFFVTTCTYERCPILSNPDIHSRLVTFGREGETKGVLLGAYVLMPDHLHAFVIMDDERLNLSAWIKSLKNALSKTLRLQNLPAPHWQKGFFDHVLRSDESYAEKWHYVRENPVRAGLVKNWSEWPFAGEIFDLQFRNDPV